MARVGEAIRVGHRVGGGVGGCSSDIVWGRKIVGSELSECKRTHTTLLEYQLGKLYKLLKKYSILKPHKYYGAKKQNVKMNGTRKKKKTAPPGI